MDKEQIIQMARDCGLVWQGVYVKPDDEQDIWMGDIERFAQIIIAAIKEEDAKICEAEHLEGPQNSEDDAYDAAIDHCAFAIRASK